MENQQNTFFKIYTSNRGKPKLSFMGPVSPIIQRAILVMVLKCIKLKAKGNYFLLLHILMNFDAMPYRLNKLNMYILLLGVVDKVKALARGVDHSKFWFTNAKVFCVSLRKFCVLQARFFIFFCGQPLDS